MDFEEEKIKVLDNEAADSDKSINEWIINNVDHKDIATFIFENRIISKKPYDKEKARKCRERITSEQREKYKIKNRLRMREFCKNNRELVNARSRVSSEKYYYNHHEEVIEKRRKFVRTNHYRQYERARNLRRTELGYFEKRYKKQIEEANRIRKENGLPPIKGWLQENLMKHYLDQVFKDETYSDNKKFAEDNNILVKRGRLDGGVEFDRYYPKLKLAFEYNGKQHYEFVPFITKTKEIFIKTQENDGKRKRMCELAGVKLIIIKYDENLSKELILQKLSEAGFLPEIKNA